MFNFLRQEVGRAVSSCRRRHVVMASSLTIAQVGTKERHLAQKFIISTKLKVLRETRPEIHATADISIYCFGKSFCQNPISCISFERKFYSL